MSKSSSLFFPLYPSLCNPVPSLFLLSLGIMSQSVFITIHPMTPNPFWHIKGTQSLFNKDRIGAPAWFGRWSVQLLILGL